MMIITTTTTTLKRLLFFVAILAAAFLALLHSNCSASAQEAQDAKTIRSLFRNEWKASAVAVLTRHFERHKKCDLQGVEVAVRNMQIFFPMTMSQYVRAVTFPSKFDPHPVVFINGEKDWNEETAVLTLIHEGTHVTLKNDKWLCGPDVPNRLLREMRLRYPPCRLFGEAQYDSFDITDALREHLNPELKKLKQEKE